MQLLSDGIAVLPIKGMMARNPNPFDQLFGDVEDTAAVLEMVQSAANNPGVSGMLLDFDSPGGFYTGGPEVADAIRAAQARKPVVAFVGGMGGSLAYWMVAQAGEVVASRSAQVGSIGAFATHLDLSKMFDDAGAKLEVIKNKEADFKAIGLRGTALTDEQRIHLQERVQTGFNEFRASVKSARPQVPDSAMRGQVFSGAEAKANGLVDRVGDVSYALACVREGIKKRG
ncbi:MAG: S49 family peptidase [Verrucomicrobiota bacterium]